MNWSAVVECGFNMPGAPEVPAVPENVLVEALSLGDLHVTCDPSPPAGYYRFWKQVQGELFRCYLHSALRPTGNLGLLQPGSPSAVTEPAGPFERFQKTNGQNVLRDKVPGESERITPADKEGRGMCCARKKA